MSSPRDNPPDLTVVAADETNFTAVTATVDGPTTFRFGVFEGLMPGGGRLPASDTESNDVESNP